MGQFRLYFQWLGILALGIGPSLALSADNSDRSHNSEKAPASPASPASCTRAYQKLSQATQTARAYEHQTSSYFREIKNPQELQQRTADYIQKLEAADAAAKGSDTAKGIATIDAQQKAGKMAQVESAKHQSELYVMTNKALDGSETASAAAIKAGGANRGALARGIGDSDKGKLAQYHELYTAESGPAKAKSDMLLNFLRSQGPEDEAKILRNILNKMGAPADVALLNRKLTNEEIRQVFRENPPLKNYLHEFPGMADALLSYRSGLITAQDLEKQIQANLFHNGPDEGFWKLFGGKIIPDFVLAGKGKNAANFFENTVFASTRNEKGVMVPVYATPTSYEGAAHLIADRVSQGSRGGVEKIYRELQSGVLAEKFNAVESLRLMVQDNPDGTVAQLKRFASDIYTIPDLTPKQKAVLRTLNAAAETRIARFSDYMRENMEFVKDATKPATEVSLKMPDETIKVFSASDNPDDVLHAAIEIMLEEEKIHGDPVKDLLQTKQGSGMKALAQAEKEIKKDIDLAIEQERVQGEIQRVVYERDPKEPKPANKDVLKTAAAKVIKEKAISNFNRPLTDQESEALYQYESYRQQILFGAKQKSAKELEMNLAKAGFSKEEIVAIKNGFEKTRPAQKEAAKPKAPVRSVQLHPARK